MDSFQKEDMETLGVLMVIIKIVSDQNMYPMKKEIERLESKINILQMEIERLKRK